MELTENQKAWLRLQNMMAVMERARNLELAKVGLSTSQAHVLYCLKISTEPLTPMRLARMMHKQPHALSTLVHRMKAQGLVTTEHDMERKNWLRVSLAKKGEEALKRWGTATMVPDVLSCLSEKEADMLLTITRKLHAKSDDLVQQMQPDPYSEPLLW